MGQPPAAHDTFINHHKYIYCIIIILSHCHSRIADDCFGISGRYSGFSIEYDYGVEPYENAIIGPGNPGQQRDCIDVQ